MNYWLMKSEPNAYSIEDLIREFDYKPSMSVKKGVTNFVEWYKDYYNV